MTYTDDALARMQEVWEKFSGVEVTPENTQKLNKALLDAVSPAIAARALNEAADDLAKGATTDAEERTVLWLRARAEEEFGGWEK